jgi:hypothetical protein
MYPDRGAAAMFKNLWCALFHRRFIYQARASGDWKEMHCNICNAMEFPAKTPAELADDLSQCEKVTLKFDNENHTLTPEEVDWLIMGATGLMPQKPASFDAGKRDMPPRRISEIETVGWAILQALHEGVDDGPQSWSDMASDQEKRIKKAAIAAIEAVTDLSQYKAQGFTPWFQPEVGFASPKEAEEYEKSALAPNCQPPVAWRCRWKSEPDWKYDEKPCSPKDHAREEPGFEEQGLSLTQAQGNSHD